MLVFPQLSSGAAAQFPFRKRVRFRTLINETRDGSEIRVGDADFESRAWELTASNLSDEEWQSIQDLHSSAEGKLQEFLFLDPSGNLLSWSEQFSDPVWQAAAGISVLGGQADPTGGANAARLTNSGATGTFSQVLSAPASFRYAGSLWARTSAAGASLRIGDAGAQSVEAAFDSSNQWRRYSAGYNLTSATDNVAYEVLVPSGASVDIFGPQLEAQVAPSAYKKTLQQAGAYAGARFDSDVLADQAMGVDRHSGVIRILWTPSPI